MKTVHNRRVQNEQRRSCTIKTLCFKVHYSRNAIYEPNSKFCAPKADILVRRCSFPCFVLCDYNNGETAQLFYWQMMWKKCASEEQSDFPVETKHKRPIQHSPCVVDEWVQ